MTARPEWLHPFQTTWPGLTHSIPPIVFSFGEGRYPMRMPNTVDTIMYLQHVDYVGRRPAPTKGSIIYIMAAWFFGRINASDEQLRKHQAWVHQNQLWFKPWTYGPAVPLTLDHFTYIRDVLINQDRCRHGERDSSPYEQRIETSKVDLNGVLQLLLCEGKQSRFFTNVDDS